MPQEQRSDGAPADPGDGNGARQLSGLQLLLLVLSKSFVPLGDESELRATHDLLGFYRNDHEKIDQTLSRTEQQFNELVEYIRRYGHILEKGPVAANRSPSIGVESVGAMVADGWAIYFGPDNAGDTDAEKDENDGEGVGGSDFPGVTDKDDHVTQQGFYQNCAFHKKRWRRFKGRPARFQLVSKGGSGKGSLMPFRGAANSYTVAAAFPSASSAPARGSGAIGSFAAESIVTSGAPAAAGGKAGVTAVGASSPAVEHRLAASGRADSGADNAERTGGFDICEKKRQQDAFTIGGLAFTAVLPEASVTPPSADGAAGSWGQISRSPGDDARAAVVAKQQVDHSIFDDEFESYFDDEEKRDLVEEVERERQRRWPTGAWEISPESERASNLDSRAAPIAPDSDVPALLGDSPLKKLDAIVGCGPGILRLCGPGLRELSLPAGVRSCRLKASGGGYWPLPCSKFKGVAATKATGYMIELQPRPEQLGFATVEAESETTPMDQGSQGPAVTGCGVAPGSSGQGAARRARARAAAASKPAAALKQETFHGGVRFEDRPGQRLGAIGRRRNNCRSLGAVLVWPRRWELQEEEVAGHSLERWSTIRRAVKSFETSSGSARKGGFDCFGRIYMGAVGPNEDSARDDVHGVLRSAFEFKRRPEVPHDANIHWCSFDVPSLPDESFEQGSDQRKQQRYDQQLQYMVAMFREINEALAIEGDRSPPESRTKTAAIAGIRQEESSCPTEARMRATMKAQVDRPKEALRKMFGMENHFDVYGDSIKGLGMSSELFAIYEECTRGSWAGSCERFRPLAILRGEMAVCQLERGHGKAPMDGHIEKMHVLLKYMKENPMSVVTDQRKLPAKLVAVGDAVFGGEADDKGMAIFLCLLEISDLNTSTTRVENWGWDVGSQGSTGEHCDPLWLRWLKAERLRPARDGAGLHPRARTSAGDASGDGFLDIDEFMTLMQNGEVKTWLSSMGLDA
ncbi:unnamed protein product, partial [Prorocentrum cordatum]